LSTIKLIVRQFEPGLWSPEGHPHAYPLSLPGHGIGDDPVDAESSKERAKRCEDGHTQNEEAAQRREIFGYFSSPVVNLLRLFRVIPLFVYSLSHENWHKKGRAFHD
jgi:hypothetical protein